MAAKKKAKTGAGRPPVTKASDQLKSFVIVEGHSMMGFDGEEKHGGDKVMLSQAQAKFFQKKGTITMDMGALFDEPDATPDTAKGSTEPAADGTRKLNL